MLASFSATDYLQQFQRMLPRGKIWHRGWGTLQSQDLLTLMPSWVRLDARAVQLLVDAFPCTVLELLPEWEASLGLPDPCTGPLATLQRRTAAVCAKFSARGGQSKEYFIHLAAALGYQIEITEFAPFVAGRGRAGDHCYDERWAFAWAINVQTSATVTYFRAGQSAAGEPLVDYTFAESLRCLIAAYAPANTVIIWTFSIDASQWDGGSTIWDDGDTLWDVGELVDGFGD